ncbi:glycosyltransferase [Bradyrhizobium nitroreducens]|uniref:glycosyltransferase n=1 Tax=Bradyrhizobium nitroreducens TaxID=709803 RepID=UPI001374E738|nr:glycosyltransferase [Bradyrhizobium nitroreducens]
MKSQPLVSIIIPAHNAGMFIGEAIDSALSQFYAAVEVVVVDDGSTDGTSEVLRTYGRAITSWSQTRSGQSAAINRGVSLASGELIAYLGADDRLHESAIEILVDRLAHEHAMCLVYPDFNLIDTNGAVIRRVSASPYDQRRLIAGFRCLPGPGALMRKTAWSRCGGWSSSFRQIPDMDLYFRLSLIGPFARVPHCLADFRVHPESTTRKPSSYDMANEPVQLVDEFFARTDLPDDVRRWENEARASALALSGFLHATGSRRSLAVRQFTQAIRLNARVALSREFMSYSVRSLSAIPPLGALRSMHPFFFKMIRW